jgi:hypothetical protein
VFNIQFQSGEDLSQFFVLAPGLEILSGSLTVYLGAVIVPLAF